MQSYGNMLALTVTLVQRSGLSKSHRGSPAASNSPAFFHYFIWIWKKV